MVVVTIVMSTAAAATTVMACFTANHAVGAVIMSTCFSINDTEARLCLTEDASSIIEDALPTCCTASTSCTLYTATIIFIQRDFDVYIIGVFSFLLTSVTAMASVACATSTAM